ncbi:hypothetical protein OsJ_00712 [Oryza sativa Japonica Group]|nr:hypothetical protein OsJ_00712 [Oryza sativa Japonica Group]
MRWEAALDDPDDDLDDPDDDLDDDLDDDDGGPDDLDDDDPDNGDLGDDDDGAPDDDDGGLGTGHWGRRVALAEGGENAWGPRLERRFWLAKVGQRGEKFGQPVS